MAGLITATHSNEAIPKTSLECARPIIKVRGKRLFR